MSENVTTATVEQFLRDLIDPNKGIPLGRYEQERVLRDLLDSRARVKELEEALDIAVCGIDEGSALRLKFERVLRGEEER